jgi:predicted aldo/keto reductase-like oxidoreductase
MQDSITRRSFVRASVTLAGAQIAQSYNLLRASASEAGNTARSSEAEWRNKQPEMRYRRLGRTGFMVSEIVCGGDPIAPNNNRHVELAIEMGLNYLDTAPAYGEGQSEMGYAAVIEGSKRQRVFLNTKISPFSPARFQAYRAIFDKLSRQEQDAILREADEDVAQRQVTVPSYFGSYFTGQLRQAEEMAIANAMEKKYGNHFDRRATYVETITRSLESSLRRLKTDHLDIMMCPHGAASAAEVQIPEIHEAFEKLRQQGKVRFLGVSAHNDPAGVLRAAMNTGVYSLAMVAYNIMNRARVEPVIEEAHRRDFGVIAMKTAQAVFQPDRSTKPVPERIALLSQTIPGELGVHQKAYRLALNNAHLSAVISNMVDEKQVKDNLPVVHVTVPTAV